LTSGANRRSCLLESRQAQILRSRRSAAGAVDDRGGAPHRRDLRHRARHQRRGARTAAPRAAAAHQADRRRAGELESWMRDQRAGLSRHAEVAKAIGYMLKRWPSFTRLARRCAAPHRRPPRLAAGSAVALALEKRRSSNRCLIVSSGVDPVKPDTRRVGTECTRAVIGSPIGSAGERCCSPPSSYR
jgi:Transposase IS66 family